MRSELTGPRSDAQIVVDALELALQGEPAPLSGSPRYVELSGALSRTVAGSDFHQIGVQAVRLLMLHVLSSLAVQRSQALARVAKGGANG